MVHVNLSDEDRRKLDEVKDAEGIDTDAEIIREFIRDAHDELTDGYAYDPHADRTTPLETDEIRETLWRYDAPAINPDHVMRWPRDRPDKRRLLAAICRFEGIESAEGVRDQIKKHLGEGDRMTVETSDPEMDAVSRRRNIHYYLEPVLDLLNKHPPADADNLPEPMFLETAETTATFEQWAETTRNAMENDDLPPEPLEARLEIGRETLNVNGNHPHAPELRELLGELEKEVEARRE